MLAQLAGALAGVCAAHAMFDLPLWQLGAKIRSGPGQWLAEGVATSGLLLTILATLKTRPAAVPMSVGLYITAAYWFTASTSFANPAVTLARAFSDTFAGIRLEDVPAFIAAQLAGTLLGLLMARWILERASEPLSRASMLPTCGLCRTDEEHRRGASRSAVTAQEEPMEEQNLSAPSQDRRVLDHAASEPQSPKSDGTAYDKERERIVRALHYYDVRYDDAQDPVNAAIRQSPTRAMFIAAGIGFVIALLVR